MTIKKLVGLLTITFLASHLAIAEEAVEAKPDSPQQYVVQAGDSLWKIADMFLENTGRSDTRRRCRRSARRSAPAVAA